MQKDKIHMETRVALIGIIIEEKTLVSQLNEIISEYSDYVIGRMGIPYPKKNISVISLAVDAPSDIISAISGKIGRLEGISVKTVYSKSNV